MNGGKVCKENRYGEWLRERERGRYREKERGKYRHGGGGAGRQGERELPVNRGKRRGIQEGEKERKKRGRRKRGIDRETQERREKNLSEVRNKGAGKGGGRRWREGGRLWTMVERR